MSRVREMNTFDGRQVESGEQGVTLFLVFRYFHDKLVPDRFEVIKGGSPEKLGGPFVLCNFPRFFSRENLRDSKEKKLDVKHTPELGPEGLELGVKGLGGSVGTPVVEKVQNPRRVREHGSRHGIERVKPCLVHLIVPQGEFKPRTRHGLARGIDLSQPLHQGEGLLHVGM